jgi:hypothetical protein
MAAGPGARSFSLIGRAGLRKNGGEEARHPCGGGGSRGDSRPLEAEGMLFVWTPQRIRIVVYFVAAYLALC